MQNHSVENYYIGLIARELAISEKQIIGVNRLLDEGATIPFIARYRKEATGNLDEIQLAAVRDKLAYFRDLDQRKQTILKTIGEQGKLTPELKEQILRCIDQRPLEDLYIPYKPKRKTKAVEAREKGLDRKSVGEGKSVSVSVNIG